MAGIQVGGGGLGGEAGYRTTAFAESLWSWLCFMQSEYGNLRDAKVELLGSARKDKHLAGM